jgi:hypothetical protein
MKSKLNVYFCGGAGIKISDQVFNNIKDLQDGFIDMDYYYLDTSTSNMKNITSEGEFWKIKNYDHTENDIDGSGGERRKNIPNIVKGVKEFLDHFKIFNKVTGEYNCIVYSSSGGSGSDIGVILSKFLMQRDIPVFVVTVGDSSNAYYTLNTINSLATINDFALECNKPLSMLYVNNERSDSNNKERASNEKLYNTLATLLFFLNGENESIDYQDMVSLLDQSQYNTMKIDPGLYGIKVYSKDFDKQDEIIIARTITTHDIDYEIDIETIHHKKGYVDNANINKLYAGQFPIHIGTVNNYLKEELTYLKDKNDKYQNLANNINNHKIKGTDKSMKDDNGFIV